MARLGINARFASKHRLLRGSQFIIDSNLTRNDKVGNMAFIRSVKLFGHNRIKIFELYLFSDLRLTVRFLRGL
jgi:hypothetical protein